MLCFFNYDRQVDVFAKHLALCCPSSAIALGLRFALVLVNRRLRAMVFALRRFQRGMRRPAQRKCAGARDQFFLRKDILR